MEERKGFLAERNLLRFHYTWLNKINSTGIEENSAFEAGKYFYIVLFCLHFRLKTLYGSNLTNVGHINDDEPRRGYTFDRGSREPNA